MSLTYPLEFQEVCVSHNKMLYDLYMHGHGEISVKVNSLKDTRVRFEIKCGRTWVYLTDKELINRKDFI